MIFGRRVEGTNVNIILNHWTQKMKLAKNVNVCQKWIEISPWDFRLHISHCRGLAKKLMLFGKEDTTFEVGDHKVFLFSTRLWLKVWFFFSQAKSKWSTAFRFSLGFLCRVFGWIVKYFLLSLEGRNENWMCFSFWLMRVLDNAHFTHISDSKRQ